MFIVILKTSDFWY